MRLDGRKLLEDLYDDPDLVSFNDVAESIKSGKYTIDESEEKLGTSPIEPLIKLQSTIQQLTEERDKLKKGIIGVRDYLELNGSEIARAASEVLDNILSQLEGESK